MTIQLPNELERDIRAEVLSGRFASVDEAMAEAVRLLLRQRNRAGARPELDVASEPIARRTGNGSDDAGSDLATEGTPAQVPAWKRIIDTMQDVPDEVFDSIPADSSAQLDHYLYGTPKRTNA